MSRPGFPLPDDSPSGSRADILLVDDQPANLVALEAVLAGLGQNLVKARSGEEALRRVLEQDFALILLDVQMPGMSGFETAALIQERDRSRHTPIIFLTAHERADVQVLRGYESGAVDYLVKPFIPAILRAKVSVFVDLFRKTEEVRRQAELLRELERREHERQLAEARQRLEAERFQQEIRLARQIQQRLFPAAPLPLPGFDVAGASYPAEATGGDYFDYVPLGDGRLGVVVGDVSGHGFGPALLMAQTRACLRAFALTRGDVGEIVALVNRALAGDIPEDRFATLVLAGLDPGTRALVYTSAGHPPGYVLGPDGAVKAVLGSTGMPVGILAEAEFGAAAAALAPDDLVLLLTDGIIEAQGPEGRLFGTERALDTVRRLRAQTAREIINGLHGAVRDYCGNEAQIDDMTAVVIKVGPAG